MDLACNTKSAFVFILDGLCGLMVLIVLENIPTSNSQESVASMTALMTESDIVPMEHTRQKVVPGKAGSNESIIQALLCRRQSI